METPTAEFRRRYLAEGITEGERRERLRIADLLHDVAAAPDVEGAVQSLIAELEATDAKPANGGDNGNDSGSGNPLLDRTLSEIGQRPSTGGDLGDQVAAIMAERRGIRPEVRR